MATLMSNSDYQEFAFSKDEFSFISDLVYEKIGIVLGDHKKNMVYGRLSKRLRKLGLTSFQDYIAKLKDDVNEEELTQLMNAITTNVTSFFRESHHFEHLKKVLADIIADIRKGQRVRIWSAGCSCGMEPYTIASVLCDMIPNIEQYDVKILATDIDQKMLEVSKKGQYGIEQLNNVPDNFKHKYTMNIDKDTFDISDKLKKLVVFKRLNLLHEWPMKGPFDVIFCRNVVIYFDNETQSVIFDKYADLLKKDGWLYIGHSETLMNISERYKLHGKSIYQKLV